MVRFDTPCLKVSGAVEYFREHMAIGDYLSQDGTAEMTWFGSGASRLGLSGRCQLDHFERLCAGLDPHTGDRLMARDKGDSRRVCYFAQISPPKDVSVLHLVGGDARIAGWWQSAVAETLSEIETLTATRVRRGGQNTDRPTGEMIATIVTHDANRALDPQLHTHVCVMNLTYDQVEARWKSVQPSGYFRHQGYLREVCYNKLAAAMRAAGYHLEPAERLGFNVKGVPPELRDTFSKRRREILKAAHEAGARSQDDLQAITARTRANKTKATAATLRDGWMRESGAHLQTVLATIAAADGTKPSSETVTAGEALRSAHDHVFERSSVVDHRFLLREALVLNRGQVVLPELKRALGTSERSGHLIRVEDEIASRAGLEAEAEFIAWGNAQLKGHGAFGKPTPALNLNSEQAAATRDVLASTSGVMILQGDAGTGKTTCLKAIVAGIQASGNAVFGCAPSSGAADVLRHELTPAAETLQQLLVNDDLQRQTKGRVFIVDEAGLISVTQMRDLCRLAARNGNRLLLVGDTKQHTSIEAGDALRCLQEFARVPLVRLTEIQRQRDPDFRRAVAMLARGQAFAAFNQFKRLGAVRAVAKEAQLWQEAAADYVRTIQAGQICLAISPVWSEIREFTAAVRTQLRAAGALHGDDRIVSTVESLKWTREERRRLQSYRPGDVLTFHRNFSVFRKHESWRVLRLEGAQLVLANDSGRERWLDPRRASGFEVGTVSKLAIAAGDRLLVRANAKALGLRNGDIVAIAALKTSGEIELTDGRTIPSWFREFAHGYCATSHASQGKTVDRGLLLMGEAGIAAGNLKQSYVANSRFRESQQIYTSNEEAARDAMMRPSDRKLALEMTGGIPAPRRSWRVRWLEHLLPKSGIAA